MGPTLNFTRRLAARLIPVTTLVTAGLVVVALQSPQVARAAGVDTPTLPETFVDQGPAPLVTDCCGDNTNRWAGAIDAIVVDPVKEPNRPRQVWIGSVNGGVWRTRNLDVTQPTQQPTWTPETDHMASLSIGALALDPTTIDPADPNARTLVAGFGGATSAVTQPHGPLAGLIMSRDAGASWTALDSDGLSGKVTGVLVRGPVIVVSTSAGVFRSQDTGAHFTLVIPGSAMALTSDPGDVGRAFVAVLGTGGGVFRVNDVNSSAADGIGAWDLVEPLTAFGADAETTASKVSLSANTYPNPGGGTRTVVVGALLVSGDDGLDLGNEFRSDQAGAAGSWQIFDPVDNVVLEHQGKLVVATDDASSTTVYLSGDQGDTFRCDVDTSSSTLSCTGLAALGLVHFDRRGLVFDDGELVLIGDGGLYERTDPHDATSAGSWYARQGNLEITESYQCAYDDLSQIAGCANQDNAVAFQPSPGARAWDDSAGYGDGTVVTVSDAPQPCSTSSVCSTRYYSGQDLRNFTRARCDASNQCDVSTHDDNGSPSLLDTDRLDDHGNPIDIGCTGFPVDVVCGDPNLQFLTPYAANPHDANRVIIASGTHGAGTVYESFDGADHVSELSGFTGVPTGAILYGGGSNADSIYVGSDEGLFVRSGPGSSVGKSTGFHVATDGNPTAVAVDPADVNSAWVVTDTGKVLHSTDGTDPTAAWTSVTGDLKPGGFAAFGLRSVAVIPAGPTTVVVVGGDDGIYAADSNAPKTWLKLSGALPNVVVTSLQYDVKDDLLEIGTLGRSSWQLRNASQMLLPPVLDASASDHSGDFNDSARFSATLTDGRGHPLQGEPVHFELTDGTNTQACPIDPVTDAQGVATCSVVLSLDAGDYLLKASSPGHGDLLPSTDTQRFTITKEETALQYTGPRSGDTHDPVVVTATIFDPDGGAPIANKKVTFTIGNPVLGQQCQSEPSDDQGHVSCQITPFQQSGDYQVVADFGGGPDYQGSQSPAVGFTILREETQLTLDPPPHLLNGAPATFGATLVEDTSSPPIGGVPVTFTLGSGGSAQTCTNNTDIHGHVSCTFPTVVQPASASSVPVTATFAGNSFYLPASASGTSLVAFFQGRATGLTLNQSLLLFPMSLVAADTGLITTSAASHTERTQAVLNAGAVSIKVLSSTVDTGVGSVTSTSTAAGVTISAVGLPLITITSLSSTASASCSSAFVASATGTTTLGTLRVAGLPIVLTSGPNQIVNLGLAKLIVNEQQPIPGTSGGIAVNGVHLIGPGLDVVVSHAQAAVFQCP